MPDYNDTLAIHRLTGRAFFRPNGQLGQIDLGNIQMHKLEYNLKRKPHLSSRRGIVFTDRNDTYGSEPKFSITGDEFATPLLELIHLGTSNADFVQTVGTGSVTFAATPGQIYDLGAMDISNIVMTVPTGKIENTDYIVDYGKGKIYIPIGTTSIAPGASVTVTFSQNAVVMNSVTMLTQLDRLGAMQIFEEDSFSLLPRNIFDFACSLSTDSGGDTKPDDYKKFTLIASVIGQITRRTLGAFDDLAFDDGAIVDYS